MDISKADIIVSMAGRDKGGLFYVLRVEDGYAYLVNGKREDAWKIPNGRS